MLKVGKASQVSLPNVLPSIVPNLEHYNGPYAGCGLVRLGARNMGVNKGRIGLTLYARP